jgi:hypothetical protein
MACGCLPAAPEEGLGLRFGEAFGEAFGVYDFVFAGVGDWVVEGFLRVRGVLGVGGSLL